MRLSRMARLRPDPRDGRAVLLSPERGLRLGDTALAVVRLCDGTRSFRRIVDELAALYAAPRDVIERDVVALLGALRARALIEGFDGESAAVPGDEALARLPDAPGDAPYTLVAELTHRCPLSCPYCSNPKELVKGKDELSTDDWRLVIDEAAHMGVMQVHLTGGEPLARADLEDIASEAHRRDLYVNLVTSGIPLDRARLERLAPHLDHVQLSIQDADPATSDRVAGFACHADKVRVAGWIRELGLPLTLNVVLHRQNLDHVADVIAMAERLGASRLELANVQLVAWALDNQQALLPTRAQLEHARAVAADAKARLAGTLAVILVLPDWHADRPRACMDGWGRRFVVVAPDGAVLPCHAARALPLTFDDVRASGLAHAWREGEAMRALRGHDWMQEPCRSCERRDVDFGGCRCQAFAMTGDLHATDPACALAPAHDVVVQARARAEAGGDRRWLYRGR